MPKDAPDARPTLTPREAAGRLKMTREAVDRLMDSGQLRCVDIGTGGRKYRRTSEAWLAEFAGRSAVAREERPKQLREAATWARHLADQLARFADFLDGIDRDGGD